MSGSIICLSTLIAYVSSIKLGTYNTYQILTNELAPLLRPAQIQQIGDSDIDVLCLQELFSLRDVIEYTGLLSTVGYPNTPTNTFSQLTIQSEFSPLNLVTPRIPCQQSQIDALNSTCAQTCRPLYGDVSYAGCMALFCPSDYDQILYTECAGCLVFYAGLQPLVAPLGFTLDLDSAGLFCLNPPDTSAFPGGLNFQNIIYNFTEGAVITTRTEYPIKNTWSYIIPSFLLIERRLQIAEIDICADTDPYNDACEDSIIVGCTHLEPTSFVIDQNVPQSPRLNEPEITSHIGLNRLQTNFIVDNVFNDDILETLGRDEDDDNIFGVFLMGDFNNGELFSRCEFLDDDGNLNADNCELPHDAPLNPYDIFGDNDLINGRDITFKAQPNEGVKCTQCIDPTEDDFNVLSALPGEFFTDPETSRDLDHIFVQDGYCKNFRRVKAARDFLDEVVEIPATGLGDLVCPEPVGFGTCVELCFGDDSCSDGQLCCSNGCGHVCMNGVEVVPASDHYAVTLDVEFKGNKGGRGDKGKCVREDERSRSRSRSRGRRKGRKRRGKKRRD